MYSKASLKKYSALYVGVLSNFNENIHEANYLGLDVSTLIYYRGLYCAVKTLSRLDEYRGTSYSSVTNYVLHFKAELLFFACFQIHVVWICTLLFTNNILLQ